jgi:hypothetical protein
MKFEGVEPGMILFGGENNSKAGGTSWMDIFFIKSKRAGRITIDYFFAENGGVTYEEYKWTREDWNKFTESSCNQAIIPRDFYKILRSVFGDFK